MPRALSLCWMRRAPADGCRWFMPSAAIYGDQGPGAISEAARPAPITAYGVDKLTSELHAGIGFGIHAVPSIGFRFFNSTGQGRIRPRPIPA